MEVGLNLWIGFHLLICSLLFADLYYAFRYPGPIAFKKAVLFSCGWILLAFLFDGWIYLRFGAEYALNFFAGYLLEKSLSVDNLLLFSALFSHFHIPESSKHRVLFYGVIGAICMRGLLIWGGIVLIEHFEWMFYVFGLFLIYAGVLFFQKTQVEQDPLPSLQNNRWVRLLSSLIRMTPDYEGNAFFVLRHQKWTATPLLLVLILIEITDLIFAIDSVPAVLGITTVPFIAYTSNIFAILGLRSLFFVLDHGLKQLRFLHYGLGLLLVFIGMKMLVKDWIPLSPWMTFLILGAIITGTIGASLWKKKA